jgi:hypothetical protein
MHGRIIVMGDHLLLIDEEEREAISFYNILSYNKN